MVQRETFLFPKCFYFFKNIHLVLTMCQAFFYMLYNTNFNSPKGPRTQVVIMIMVLKMRTLSTGG